MDVLAREVKMHRLRRIGDECVALGARSGTVASMTGISAREVRRLFFNNREKPTGGNKPFSQEWLHRCNLIDKVHASLLLATYRQMTDCSVPQDEALLAAFRLCVARFSPDGGVRIVEADTANRFRLTFDRAFALVCYLDGIWATKARALQLVTCSECGSDHVRPIAAPTPSAFECPFCVLCLRIKRDPRCQAAFVRRSLPPIPSLRLGPLGTVIVQKP